MCTFVPLNFFLSYRSLRGKVLEEHMRTISQLALDRIRAISLFVHAQRLYITSNDRIAFVSFSCLDKSVLLGATCSLVSIWFVFAPVVRTPSPPFLVHVVLIVVGSVESRGWTTHPSVKGTRVPGSGTASSSRSIHLPSWRHRKNGGCSRRA